MTREILKQLRNFDPLSYEMVADWAPCKPIAGAARTFVIDPLAQPFILEAIELEAYPHDVLFASLHDEATLRNVGRLVFTRNRAELGDNALFINAQSRVTITFNKDVEGDIYAIGSSVRRLDGAQ
jgi:hypothetical protein